MLAGVIFPVLLLGFVFYCLFLCLPQMSSFVSKGRVGRHPLQLGHKNKLCDLAKDLYAELIEDRKWNDLQNLFRNSEKKCTV